MRSFPAALPKLSRTPSLLICCPVIIYHTSQLLSCLPSVPKLELKLQKGRNLCLFFSALSLAPCTVLAHSRSTIFVDNMNECQVTVNSVCGKDCPALTFCLDKMRSPPPPPPRMHCHRDRSVLTVRLHQIIKNVATLPGNGLPALEKHTVYSGLIFAICWHFKPGFTEVESPVHATKPGFRESERSFQHLIP